MGSTAPDASIQAAPVIADGLSSLAPRYDALLCDLWGVMHDGRRASPDAVEAVRRFRAGNRPVVFITNSPRPSPEVRIQVAGLGIPADAFDAIVTSGDVTIAAIAAAGRKRFHHIGPPRDLALFEAVQRQTGEAPTLATLEEADCVVVTGLFDDATETPADYAPALASMRRRDLPMICANPDLMVHVGEQLIYCGGALAEAYRAVGGRTVLAGKPHPPIYAAALAAAGRTAGRELDRRRVLAIGDGLPTDVAGAANEGLDVLFISGGLHRDAFHPEGAAVPVPLDYAERLGRLDAKPFAAMPFLRW